jgi:cyclic pyranopterin monophosphate synthase
MAGRPRERGRLSHLDQANRARMVSVEEKKVTKRTARAEAWVRIGRKVAARLRKSGSIAKGNVLETARIAGIMAAKRTAYVVPMCHQLKLLDVVEVDAGLRGNRVLIRTRIACEGKTGVEMEALTAAIVAALTVYDMCKSADKGICIGPVRLLEKTGGKSGRWHAGRTR